MDYSTTVSSLAPAGADQGRAGALARERTPRMNKVQLNARSLGRIGNRRAAAAYTLTDFPAMLFARPYAHPAPASQTRAAGARTRPRTLRHPASLRPSHHILVVSFVACDSPSRTAGAPSLRCHFPVANNPRLLPAGYYLAALRVAPRIPAFNGN